ncbi:MAG: hypothetical protein ACKVKS_00920 [Candidatus Poseidoniales archaeon]|jgi:hypothetical protein|tara:strand:+ start:190 stop:1020 length:831 start_codon:yes stop_codon:yes gene_type:complete
MAWPFSKNTAQNQDADAALTEERLKIMANIAIEQVPLPEEGELNAEDAWTISPGATMARLNSIGSVPTVAASLAPTASPTQVSTTVDTSGLERLISTRLDMVEDVLRKVELRLTDDTSAAQGDGSHSEGGASSHGGDTIVTASGEVISVSGTERLMETDNAPLVELYEAQALAANPFLHAPSFGATTESNKVGAPTISALLLDNMSGMAAVSFAQKAMASGMLSDGEGRKVLAIVQLAEPGQSEAALDDHLTHKELLTFSSLVSSWRNVKSLRGEV